MENCEKLGSDIWSRMVWVCQLDEVEPQPKYGPLKLKKKASHQSAGSVPEQGDRR